MHRGLVTLIALGIATRARAGEADDQPAAAPAAPSTPPANEAANETAPEVEAVPRTPDTSFGAMFRAPFRSARLFAMPTADVVGAYTLTLSGEGSLLEKPGVLTSAGVFAVGFGDLAQLEYRHTEAIGITGLNAPVPAVGVQLKLPIPEHSGVPAIGVAFRLGVPRGEVLDGHSIAETVTDLYFVGRLRFASLRWLTLHGGTRISFAKVAPADPTQAVQKTLWLPAAGYEVAMTPRATIVGEIELAPQFKVNEGTPAIGRGLLGRLGMKWRILPSIALEGSLGYQLDDATPNERFDAVVTWDIRLGAAVFVPWGALACRAVGVFCN